MERNPDRDDLAMLRRFRSLARFEAFCFLVRFSGRLIVWSRLWCAIQLFGWKPVAAFAGLIDHRLPSFCPSGTHGLPGALLWRTFCRLPCVALAFPL